MDNLNWELIFTLDCWNDIFTRKKIVFLLYSTYCFNTIFLSGQKLCITLMLMKYTILGEYLHGANLHARLVSLKSVCSFREFSV